jgi:pimeloyl-ACP methyl ester carboxylesterase
VSGTADTAIVFIHGGLADRSFWDGQHGPFADRFRVVALDLAGHGESGHDRPEWGILPFARDVVAVMDAESVPNVILIGNSLGGPVAIEAALLAGARALGVVGVDTFQDIGLQIDPTYFRAQAEAWRQDYNAKLDEMLRVLFHPDADPSLVADVRLRMSKTPVDVVSPMFESFAGYDTGVSACQLRIPVRSINGDRFPTDIATIRTVIADFDAVVLPHIGHYPMLECPEEFNGRLAEVVTFMAGRTRRP